MRKADLAANVLIGCAGWAIPKQHRDDFVAEGSHLERYAQRFPAVEINSSFYRPHKAATYERWAASVPEQFRFAIKVPKTMTHQQRLKGAGAELAQFLSEVSALGEKQGPLLVQLPPSLVFDTGVVKAFFQTFRKCFAGSLVCEPRHPTWFTPEADRFLTDFGVARVAADPALTPSAAEPGGWTGLAYLRLHGSPKRYYSAYSAKDLAAIAAKLKQAQRRNVAAWCIFNNTAAGAATQNALALLSLIK